VGTNEILAPKFEAAESTVAELGPEQLFMAAGS
jgi:hypothetical protein